MREIVRIAESTYDEAPLLAGLQESFLDPVVELLDDEWPYENVIVEASYDFRQLFPDYKAPKEYCALEEAHSQRESVVRSVAFICGMLAANPAAFLMGKVDAGSLRELRGRKREG